VDEDPDRGCSLARWDVRAKSQTRAKRRIYPSPRCPESARLTNAEVLDSSINTKVLGHMLARLASHEWSEKLAGGQTIAGGSKAPLRFIRMVTTASSGRSIFVLPLVLHFLIYAVPELRSPGKHLTSKVRISAIDIPTHSQ
jgi:hypothetical protein